MQKSVKGLLTAGVVLCAVGAGLFAVGAGTGGIAYVGAADLNKMDGNAKVSKGVKMEKTKIEKFDRIEATLGDADFRILPSGDQNYYLSYELYGEEDPMEYEVEEGTLKLSDHAGNTHFFQIDISFISYLLGDREILYADNQVTLHVPEDAVFEDSMVKISDGDLELEHFSGKNMNVELLYGDIKLSGCSFENGEINSSDGSMEASGLDCKNMQMQFQYGDVSLKEAYVEDCLVKISDGDMQAEELNVQGNLEIKNSYGDVELQFSGECREVLSMDLKTSYGEIEISDDFRKNGYLTEQEDLASYESTAENSQGVVKAELSDGDIILK